MNVLAEISTDLGPYQEPLFKMEKNKTKICILVGIKE